VVRIDETMQRMWRGCAESVQRKPRNCGESVQRICASRAKNMQRMREESAENPHWADFSSPPRDTQNPQFYYVFKNVRPVCPPPPHPNSKLERDTLRRPSEGARGMGGTLVKRRVWADFFGNWSDFSGCPPGHDSLRRNKTLG
jgi:hypothetical protein